MTNSTHSTAKSKIGTLNGTGFSTLHPNTSTRSHVLKHDRDFAREIAGHNKFCKTQKGCD